MKNRPGLRTRLIYFAGLFVFVLFSILLFDVLLRNASASTLTDRPIWLAGATMLLIMAMEKPEDHLSRREWRHFLWVMPATCVTLGIGGYAVMWWLFGNHLGPFVETVAWSALVICTVLGPLIAWLRGRIRR